MHGDGHIGWNVGDRRVDHSGVNGRQHLRVVTAVGDLRAQLGIAEISEVDFIELQVTATGIGKGTHGLSVGLTEIPIELVHVGIDRLRHRVAPVAEMQR